MMAHVDASKICSEQLQPHHVEKIVEAASSYAWQLSNPGLRTWFLSPDRRKRVERLLKTIEKLAEDEDDDPGYVSTQVTEYCPSDDAIELIDAMCSPEKLRQSAIYLRQVLAAQTNAGATPPNEFRDRLWETIASQYERASRNGRKATVTTDPIDNTVKGPFLDLVQSVHRALGEEEVPSGHSVREWLKKRRKLGRGSKQHPLFPPPPLGFP